MICRRTSPSGQTGIFKLVTIIEEVLLTVLVTAGQGGKHTDSNMERQAEVYLWRTLEMHARYWECSHIHGNTTIQV